MEHQTTTNERKRAEVVVGLMAAGSRWVAVLAFGPVWGWASGDLAVTQRPGF